MTRVRTPSSGWGIAGDRFGAQLRPDIDAARAAGADVDEIVGTLIAVAPTVGLARVVSAAPELALSLGYDVDAALERPGEDAE